ncbi:DUF7860 family protein [Halobacterium jilantaiense]|uniref:Uncharacterized protein n=1 Tax=Halobacterium jilantaiense TaxID=355548 RepID=A0A1I0PX80_9EURY|nr:hypothetical protein [Halobacterium jilantaiense]SEW19213.1 hypothetical protein SAMN04487945_2065 [Halobacterium jilantaiense]
MARAANLDYPDLAKYGTLASLALLLVGAAGTTLGSGRLPGWELTVLLDLEIIGVLGIVVCPFLFGIALPLVE